LPLAGQCAAAQARQGLLGKPASEWQATNWLNSAPLTLRGLRGKRCSSVGGRRRLPVLRATAPALNEFYRAYHSQGLAVIGFYIINRPNRLKTEAVEQYARKFGFQFPVAIDPGWRTLNDWWLDRGDQQ